MPNSCLEMLSWLAKRGKKYIFLLRKRTSLRTSSLPVILRLFVLVKRNSVLCAAEYLTRGNRRWWEFVGRFSPYRAQFPRKSNELPLTAPTVLQNWSSRKYSEGMVTCLSGHHHGSPYFTGPLLSPAQWKQLNQKVKDKCVSHKNENARIQRCLIHTREFMYIWSMVTQFFGLKRNVLFCSLH